MAPDGLHGRYQLAKDIAQEASAFLLSHESMRLSTRTKAENDYVTEADGTVERMIREAISKAFPSDSVYGEEFGGETGSRRRWIIDPIDGTVNFMASFPDYTVSIAYEDEEGLAFGVVAVPRQHEVFCAFRGEGAFLNDSPIHTDESEDTSRTLALLVPPHRHHEMLDGYIVRMRRFYEIISDVRSIGSAALSLCYVACGRASMYYETALHIYDCAAGIVIVHEAGGMVTLLSDDESWMDIAASSAAAHRKMLETIDG